MLPFSSHVDGYYDASDQLAHDLRRRAESHFHRQEAVYPDSSRYDVHYYLVCEMSGTPANRVFRRVKWVDVGDLLSYDILEGNRDVIGKLQTRANDVRS